MTGSFGDRWSRRLAAAILAHKVVAILLCVCTIVTLGLQLLDWRASGNARIFFGEDNPELHALEALEETYSKARSVIFILEPAGETIFTGRGLQAVAAVSERAWQLPYVLHVDSISEYERVEGDGELIDVNPLFDPATSPDDSAAAEIKRIALNEKEIVNRLIGEDGRASAVFALLLLPDLDRDAIHDVTEAANALSQSVEAEFAEVRVRLSGGVIADHTFATAGMADRVSLLPLAAGILVIALLLLLRSVLLTGVLLFALLGTVASALGLALATGTTINVATASSPVIILVLALASGIHILVGAAHASAIGAGTAREAVERSLTENLIPITAACGTTIIGFMCLSFSPSPPLRELGAIVSLGVAFGWLYTLTLLPALLSYLPPIELSGLKQIQGVLARAAAIATERRFAVMLTFAVVSVVAFTGVARLVPDDRYVEYFDESFAFRRDTDYLERHLTGLNVLHFSLQAGTETNAVFEPSFLKSVDGFVDWLEAQPEIVHVTALSTLLKRLNQAVNGGAPAEYRIGQTAAHNAQSLFFFELSQRHGHDLATILSTDRAQTKVSAIVSHVSSRELLALGERATRWLERNEPALATPATGLSVAFALVSQRNIEGMIFGTVFALVLVSGIMLVVFRSVPLGLLSLVPNLLPICLAFGLWGFLVGEVNLAATVVTALALGISVDDTIHLVMRYQQGRKALGQTPEGAARHSITTAGLAITLTTIVIASGFCVLVASGFQLTRFLGGLTALIVVFALIADALLLTALLVSLDRWRGRSLAPMTKGR
ncbi:MAG: MMPL family transporter [Pseudomonadota bacterium]